MTPLTLTELSLTLTVVDSLAEHDDCIRWAQPIAESRGCHHNGFSSDLESRFVGAMFDRISQLGVASSRKSWFQQGSALCC